MRTLATSNRCFQHCLVATFFPQNSQQLWQGPEKCIETPVTLTTLDHLYQRIHFADLRTLAWPSAYFEGNEFISDWKQGTVTRTHYSLLDSWHERITYGQSVEHWLENFYLFVLILFLTIQKNPQSWIETYWKRQPVFSVKTPNLTVLEYLRNSDSKKFYSQKRWVCDAKRKKNKTQSWARSYFKMDQIFGPLGRREW